MRKSFFTIFFALIALVGWAQKVVSPAEFNTLINEQAALQLIDVRTPGEYNGGHLAYAQNMDSRSADQATQLATLDKNQPVFVYCLSGGRSAATARKLAGMGFSQVYDMAGGVMAWKREGLPLEGAATQASGSTKADYDKTINSKLPVLIDFYAPWCAPCRKMAPMLDELKAEYEGKFVLGKFDADKNDALMKEIGIIEIPTLFVYKNGKQTWKHVGYVDKETLIKELGL